MAKCWSQSLQRGHSFLLFTSWLGRGGCTTSLLVLMAPISLQGQFCLGLNGTMNFNTFVVSSVIKNGHRCTKPTGLFFCLQVSWQQLDVAQPLLLLWSQKLFVVDELFTDASRRQPLSKLLLLQSHGPVSRTAGPGRTGPVRRWALHRTLLPHFLISLVWLSLFNNAGRNVYGSFLCYRQIIWFMTVMQWELPQSESTTSIFRSLWSFKDWVALKYLKGHRSVLIAPLESSSWMTFPNLVFCIWPLCIWFVVTSLKKMSPFFFFTHAEKLEWYFKNF